ncbi:hypothetical protein [Nonomuraea sp. NPDC003201]
MKRKFGRKAFLAGLSAPVLGLTLFGPAPVEAGTMRTEGPCLRAGHQRRRAAGARSICPPGTWTHWHQVHIRCRFIAEPTEDGPVVGGTSVSEVFCGRPTAASGPGTPRGPITRKSVDRGDDDDGFVAYGELVVTGCHAAVAFDQVDAAFHGVAQSVERGEDSPCAAAHPPGDDSR